MAGSISGKVTDASGGTISNVAVQANGSDGAPVAVVRSNNSGNYQLTNLNAGTYTVLTVDAGAFTPNTFRVTITQNQNVTGRNFKKNKL